MTDHVWVNGRVMPAGTPALRADDAGFQLGLSVFDTVLFEDGCYYFLEEHLERLRRGAEELSIPWPPPVDPVRGLVELQEALGLERVALRITLSRGGAGTGPTLAITAREVAIPAAPGAVVEVARERRLVGDPIGQLKSTNRLSYVLAREQAQANGAWEALFVSTAGDVLEGTVSNFFCVQGDEVVTAPIELGCLPGTLRGLVVRELRERPIEADGRPLELAVRAVALDVAAAAREAFLTNTTGRVIPVAELRALGEGRDRSRVFPGSEGPVTRAVAERVREVERRYRESQLESGIGSKYANPPGR